MTITLNIRPEVQAELARQAASQGCALEAYAASLLEDAAHLRGDPVYKNLREVFESVKGLADDLDFSRNKSAARPVNLSFLDEAGGADFNSRDVGRIPRRPDMRTECNCGQGRRPSWRRVNRQAPSFSSCGKTPLGY